MNATDLEQLRAAFASLETLDPCGTAYARLCDILDRADDEALQAAVDADIKFVSSLALNRLHKRALDDFNYVGSRHHY